MKEGRKSFEPRKYFDRDSKNFVDDRWKSSVAARYDFIATHDFLRSCFDVIGRGSGTSLDAGCGPGIWLPVLCSKFEFTTACDISNRMLAAARGPNSLLDVRFMQADVRALPLKSASMSFIWSCHVLEYIPDLPAAMAEFYRVLQPGGHLAIVTKSRHAYCWRAFKWAVDLIWPTGRLEQEWRSSSQLMFDGFKLLKTRSIAPRVPINPNDVNACASKVTQQHSVTFGTQTSFGERNPFGWHIGVLMQKEI